MRDRLMKLLLHCLILLAGAGAGLAQGGEVSGGIDANTRWERLLAEQETEEERTRVEAVNRFVNRMRRETDRALWGREDYWAGPREFFARGAGDCEDFVIAKYIGLRRLRIPEARLRLVQSRIYDPERSHIEPHMVLLYRDPEQREWVLDNLRPAMEMRARRADLIFNYAFNTEGLWLLDDSGAVQMRTNPSMHGKWLAFRQRVLPAPGPDG